MRLDRSKGTLEAVLAASGPRPPNIPQYSAGTYSRNVHLKWAFSEAATLFLRWNVPGRKYFERIEKKHGKGKALSILAAKLGRAVYYMLLRKKPFDLERFVTV